MAAARALAVLLALAAASACSGSGPAEELVLWTRQSPPSSRDVPPTVRDDPSGSGADAGSACVPCGRPFSCQVGGGQPVPVQSMIVKGGACALLDTPTDVVVLHCGGSVTTSAGRVVGSWHGAGQGRIEVELSNETVTCSQG